MYTEPPRGRGIPADESKAAPASSNPEGQGFRRNDPDRLPISKAILALAIKVTVHRSMTTRKCKVMVSPADMSRHIFVGWWRRPVHVCMYIQYMTQGHVFPGQHISVRFYWLTCESVTVRLLYQPTPNRHKQLRKGQDDCSVLISIFERHRNFIRQTVVPEKRGSLWVRVRP